jgi:Cu(I)/Ag(I) efflux system membrane fusion protein
MPFDTRRFFLTALMCVGTAVLLPACSSPKEQAESSEVPGEAMDDTAMEHALKHLDEKYVCPMHPQIIRDEPGNCPLCGMDLVLKQIDGRADERPTVTVRGEIIQSIGVRTTKVARDTLWRLVQTVGRVTYDETVLSHVHPRAEGWMEQLAVRAEGDPVEAGQMLGEFYSPEILGAQVDYLVALGYTGSAAQQRLEKARNRLRLLGVPEETISHIHETRETHNTVPVTAPHGGIITKLGAREGMYVTPSSEIFTIADLSRVWVMVDVFEHQIDWITPGLSAEITLPAYPGQTWKGQVDYLYPELDPRSRTLRVRLVFANTDGLLKPNMFAEVKIYGGPKEDVLAVPREALIVTGERESVVRALGDGRFQPVDVVTGMRGGGKVEILSGLQAGDEVVVSGQFLIDSESNLQASFLRMSDDGGDSAGAQVRQQ